MLNAGKRNFIMFGYVYVISSFGEFVPITLIIGDSQLLHLPLLTNTLAVVLVEM